MVLHGIVLCYFLLHSIVWYYKMLHAIALVLHNIVLYSMVLHCIVFYGIALYCMASINHIFLREVTFIYSGTITSFYYGLFFCVTVLHGGNLLTMQSLILMSYFFVFLSTFFGNLEVRYAKNCNLSWKCMSATWSTCLCLDHINLLYSII